MDESRCKLFKDPVHGYVPVPRQFCDEFVDTPIFQRLRHIEQTSMRPLYPGAHHDRFVHSLGVFHLGRVAVAHLRRPERHVDVDDWGKLKRTFEVACMMHDCGHAPFSHTCEHFYNHSDTEGARKRAEEWLKTLIDDPFRTDFGRMAAKPAAHETFSAALLITKYKEQVGRVQADLFLAARMITGCRYFAPKDDFEKIANCLIDLLNGTAIDVDKLDYIIRDTWASGVKNTAVDVERLLGALMIGNAPLGPRLCFHKSALSVIQSVVDARNYLYEWIYNHHTVLYYADLLDKALKQLGKDLAPDHDPDHFWEAVFSVRSFEKPTPINSSSTVYLPTDGDVMYLLKVQAENPKYKMVPEILSHHPERVPLWKTYGEYKRIIDKNEIPDIRITETLKAQIPEILAAVFTGYDKAEFLVIDAKSRHASIDRGDIMVEMGEDTPVSYTKILGEQENRSGRFFYVFVPRDLREQTGELCKRVCSVFA